MHAEIILEINDVRKAIINYVTSVYKVSKVMPADLEFVYRGNEIGCRVNGDFDETELRRKDALYTRGTEKFITTCYDGSA